MADSPAQLARLRRLVATTACAQEEGSPEDWLATGLPAGKVHELHAAEQGDASAAAGFAVALALASRAMPVLWLRTAAAEREGGRLHATGLLELGLDPAALVLVLVPDEAALLRAAGDIARCAGVGTLVVEGWGRMAGLDLTATRRLQLAAEASGVTVQLLRIAGAAQPSAAATRWSVAACPSTMLDADAPGRPAYLIQLQRRRGGPAGQRWRVEWDRDTQKFDAAPLPGAGLPLASDRAPALDPSAFVRQAG